MTMYRIRAHHGMCFAYYRGEGYSNEFTENMWQMKQLLEKNPVIKLEIRTDDVCKACPNNKEGICTSDNRAAEYDRQVLSRLGLHEGDTMRWLEFALLVHRQIIQTGTRAEICGGCQWNRLCQ